MADHKAQEEYIDRMLGARGPEIISVWHKSKYDSNFNRCYIEQLCHVKLGLQKQTDVSNHSLTDSLSDEWWYLPKSKNGKKVGMVFDRYHKPNTDTNLGWDAAPSWRRFSISSGPATCWCHPG